MKTKSTYSSLSLVYLFLITLLICACTHPHESPESDPQPVSPECIRTQGELAKRIQISKQLLSAWESQNNDSASSIHTQTYFPKKTDPGFWEKYLLYGMTENHGNYRALHTYDKECDPSNVMHSYFYAIALWQKTLQGKYRDEAELIYYNAICHLQQPDGHWGNDNTPGNKIQDVCLKPTCTRSSFEATRSYTDKLQNIANLSYFISGTTLYIPFLRENQLDLSNKEKRLVLDQQTTYPFGNQVHITIKQNSLGIDKLLIAIPSWTSNQYLTINEEKIPANIQNGFFRLERKLKEGDRIHLEFTQTLRFSKPINKENTNLDQLKIYYGPLLLGYRGPEVIKLTSLDRIIPAEQHAFLIENKGIKIHPVYKHPDDTERSKNEKEQILF